MEECTQLENAELGFPQLEGWAVGRAGQGKELARGFYLSVRG